MNPALPRVVMRLVGAGLLGATAYIHLKLWHEGYRSIHVVGPLFLIGAVSAIVLAVAVLSMRNRLLMLSALGAAGLQAGIVIGLLISTKHGLFGFKESSQATYYWQSVGIEVAGTVVLLLLAGISVDRRQAITKPSVHSRRVTAGR